MQIAWIAAALLLSATLVAMAWQHLRYCRARREIVQDRQPLLHGKDVFHVVSFLRVAAGADVVEALRKLEAETGSVPGVRWVYAGVVVVNGLGSSQVGADVDWNAVVLLQYPSRRVYDEVSASQTHRQALSRFEKTYSHGFVRSRWLNLLIPQLLLARRAVQILTRAPSHFPFVPAAEEELAEADARRIRQLRAARERGGRAVVVVNLVQRGTPAQREADRGYVGRMMGLMAEGGHGPMHIGRAVTLEGTARFDQVALVYYPGVEYFAAMAGSRFFRGIVGGKQLGDTQASVTVPVLDAL